MRVDDNAGLCDALFAQPVEDRPGVSPRRSSVEHERAPIAGDRAHRRPIRRAGRHPVDVLADLLQHGRDLLTLDSGAMPGDDGYFDERVAARYDETESEMFDPAVV